MINKIIKFIFISISSLSFCWFANKYNVYNEMIIVMLVTLWYDDLDKEME